MQPLNPKVGDKGLTSNLQAHTLSSRCLQVAYNNLPPKEVTLPLRKLINKPNDKKQINKNLKPNPAS